MPVAPRVSAELPESGERFEGLLPPVVAAPVFSIRRPASLPLALTDYVATGVMTATQATYLAQAVRDRANILVAGGTSTGKTTLTNALLGIAATTGDRIILIEDTRELRCDAANVVALRTATGRDARRSWSARPYACAPIAFRSARCAALKRSTSSKPGAPAIPAGSARSTPAPPAPRSTGSSSSSSKRCRACRAR